MIKVEKLTKEYRVGKVKVTAVDNLSCVLKKGSLHAIIGRSGSGKSTLMHIIGGLDKPTTGEVYIGGKDITKFKDKDLAKFRNKQVGFVFQSFNLEPNYTCIDNIILPMIPNRIPRKERLERVIELLNMVGLQNRARHKAIELSGGEKQRVAIARALVNNPEIILADEPTGNLDSTNGQQIMNILRDLANRGKTIILVTHNKEDAKYADNIIELKDGKIFKTYEVE
ncbi:MAG: ABC transporter ATP-binding protein [bacterium]